jgi:HPt (histidine-containing phosphotransfer) domain-containing protein
MDYPQETLLDLTVINGLKELDDAGSDTFFQEVLTVFTDEFPLMTAKIAAAVEDNRPDDVAKVAHALKGASLCIGAKELSARCRIIEFRGRDKQLENLDELLQSLHTVFAATLAEINNL